MVGAGDTKLVHHTGVLSSGSVRFLHCCHYDCVLLHTWYAIMMVMIFPWVPINLV
jgi:hypothetical protein